MISFYQIALSGMKSTEQLGTLSWEDSRPMCDSSRGQGHHHNRVEVMWVMPLP